MEEVEAAWLDPREITKSAKSTKRCQASVALLAPNREPRTFLELTFKFE